MGDQPPSYWIEKAEARERARRAQQQALQVEHYRAKLATLTALEQLKATRCYLFASQEQHATMRAPYENHKLTEPWALRTED